MAQTGVTRHLARKRTRHLAREGVATRHLARKRTRLYGTENAPPGTGRLNAPRGTYRRRHVQWSLKSVPGAIPFRDCDAGFITRLLHTLVLTCARSRACIHMSTVKTRLQTHACMTPNPHVTDAWSALHRLTIQVPRIWTTTSHAAVMHAPPRTITRPTLHTYWTRVLFADPRCRSVPADGTLS